ncbi:hypothetical protein DLM75_17325 [Leptospira stimsonii]|uniref:Uncharacterized protein n=1 Tax=Leptospira stimsonii TaxID=2202203 RepID=A0A396Z0J7_9LEPT|nr:hypothetical protein DLM75_17325 [Leptospira stimsonii]
MNIPFIESIDNKSNCGLKILNCENLRLGIITARPFLYSIPINQNFFEFVYLIRNTIEFRKK